ncbi:MAG TPA: protein kinase, partial [Pseudomonadota bacterium]|nr:protein kinase [Pseudomonadota bacterium]
EVQTADGALLGTPAFMAPELWQSSGRADEKTDVYALGVMAYQMLAGRELFEVSDPIALMYQHATRRPTPLSNVALDIPAALSDLVADMLQKEQAQRPTMAAVSQALQGLAATLGEVSRPSRILPAASSDQSGPAGVGPASVASVGPGVALAPADARTLDGQLRREESTPAPHPAAQSAMPQPSQILSPVALPEDATLKPRSPAVVEAAGVALDAATQRREAPVVRRTLPLLLVALLLLVLALVALRG